MSVWYSTAGYDSAERKRLDSPSADGSFPQSVQEAETLGDAAAWDFFDDAVCDGETLTVWLFRTNDPAERALWQLTVQGELKPFFTSRAETVVQAEPEDERTASGRAFVWYSHEGQAACGNDRYLVQPIGPFVFPRTTEEAEAVVQRYAEELFAAAPILGYTSTVWLFRGPDDDKYPEAAWEVELRVARAPEFDAEAQPVVTAEPEGDTDV